MSADVDLDAFPVVRKGHQFQDFVDGQVFEHHWGRTVTHGDNALFSTATCNWNPMHLNAEFARAHGHPDVVVNPMLVLCTVVGLSVEDLSEVGGPFLGMRDVVFRAPVHPGDTLTARSTVIERRESDSRPNAGVVSWWTEAHNQRGEFVLDFVRTNLVAKRRPSTIGD
jgi:itaconyl-CoA hydratase